MTLEEMLNTMDLPINRKDLSNESNIRWLLRNVPVRNGDNEHCIDVMRLLFTLLRKRIKDDTSKD